MPGFKDQQAFLGNDTFYFLDMIVEDLHGMSFIFQSVMENTLPDRLFHGIEKLVYGWNHSRGLAEESSTCLVERIHNASIPAVRVPHRQNNFCIRVDIH